MMMRRLMILMVAVIGMFGSDAYAVYDAGSGRWLERDPAGHVDGANLYEYVKSAPNILSDSSGRQSGIVIDYDEGMPVLRPKGDPMITPGATACDGYSSTQGSKCINKKGCTVTDTYPDDAQLICRRFIQKYKFSQKTQCVAKCLILAEMITQWLTNDCDDRNKIRFSAHIDCYTKCRFIPYKGLPEGGAKVGWEDLLPSLFK